MTSREILIRSPGCLRRPQLFHPAGRLFDGKNQRPAPQRGRALCLRGKRGFAKGYDTAGSFTRGAYRCLDTRRTYRWLQRLSRCIVPAVPVWGCRYGSTGAVRDFCSEPRSCGSACPAICVDPGKTVSVSIVAAPCAGDGTGGCVGSAVIDIACIQDIRFAVCHAEFIDRIILSIPKTAAAAVRHNGPCDVAVRAAGDIGVNCKGCTACCHISAGKADAKRILGPHRRLLHAVGVGSAVIDIGSCYRAGDGAVDICASICCEPVSIGWAKSAAAAASFPA